tara:strand:+ start:6098 stop:7096 length:999 start_codon:yes stop_codon:yes gene_type:complete
MCKLFGVTSTEGWNRKTLNATLNAARASFSGERHGFGFAVKTGQGIYRERYVDPQSFAGIGTAKEVSNALRHIKEAIDFDADTRGKLGRLGGGLIVHGRTSTNELDTENTHPFVRKGWALAHNGCVDYDGPERYKRGTCDSEDLLNSFVYGEGLSELPSHYSGYAAILAMTPSGGFIAYRDDTAELCVSKLLSQDGYAFATKAAHMKAILKKAAISHTEPMLIRKERAIIFDGDNPEPEVKRFDGPNYRFATQKEREATGVGFGRAVTYKEPATYTTPSKPSKWSGGRKVVEYSNGSKNVVSGTNGNGNHASSERDMFPDYNGNGNSILPPF